MQDEKQLHEIARDFPCYVFTGEEICVLCRVSQNVVSRIRSMPDSPFFLNKCRPEWFLEWMRTHPDFQLTKALPPSKTIPADTTGGDGHGHETWRFAQEKQVDPNAKARRKAELYAEAAAGLMKAEGSSGQVFSWHQKDLLIS